MGSLDHWHPVLLSRVGRTPVQARVLGRDLALFRRGDGSWAALEDRCPHRHMRFSRGTVVGDRLQCAYHGWTFTGDGCGESPGTPKLQACALSYDTREAHGAVWVRPRGSSAAFPELDTAGYHFLGAMHHVTAAPLEPTLDNFCEIEHTPTAHALFGYRLDKMHEVSVRCESDEKSVRVINVGEPKPMPLIFRAMLGIRKNYLFYDDWTTRFSPVYSEYNHWWADPASGHEGLVRWRLYIFFTPLDEGRTALFSLPFVRSGYPGPKGGLRVFGWLLRRMLDKEIRLDLRILSGLADYGTSLLGMKLGRFDKSLGLNRERIQSVYRGLA